MKLQLTVLTPGKGEGKVIPITLTQFLIGRDPQCHLRPASPVISKRHCALLVREGKVFVRDFDSTNGTFVNDEPVKGEVELHPQDRLKVGPLLFAVGIEAGAPVDKQTPVPPTKTPVPPTKAAAKVGSKTPAPPTKAPAAPAPEAEAPRPAASSDDDAIAEMLLGIGDEGGGGAAGADSVPEGSTVMDLPAPFPQEGGEGQPGQDKKAPA